MSASFCGTADFAGETAIAGLASFADDVTVTDDVGLLLEGGFAFTANGKKIDASASTVGLTIGDADGDSVTPTEAIITAEAAAHATAGSAAGVLTIANTATIGLDDGGTITVAGAGSVVLPNTTFGEGTYTATEEVTITALALGDAILLAASDGSGELALSGGTGLVLAQCDSDANGATYTLKKGNGGEKVEISDNGIVIPCAATVSGASVVASGKAGIVIGDGTITLSFATGGVGGSLELIEDNTIGEFTECTTIGKNHSPDYNVAWVAIGEEK